MVVEAADAVVAVVAMGASLRPKNITRFTKFEFIDMRIASNAAIVLHVQVKYFVVAHVSEITMKLRINLR